MSVNTGEYYSTYHGHETRFLRVIHDGLRQTHKSLIFLAGDSSLDNKFWLSTSEDAVNGYERILRPPRMKTDVCYHLNREAQERKAGLGCVNTAVEATSLNNRACCSLLEQDQFIRDHITADDYLVVSVGGNDIALTPVLMTVLNLAALVCCTPQVCIEKCSCACPINSHIDLGCAGCGLPGCLSGSLLGWPLGMGYFVDLFQHRVGNYVRRMVGKQKPKMIIVCMIYHLDEAKTGSWADGALTCMCYDCNPSKLQNTIEAVFKLATSRIRVDGTEVVAFPLFEVLDGKTSKDYIERVEPSTSGGAKMAAALMDLIVHGVLPQAAAYPCSGSESASPEQQTM